MKYPTSSLASAPQDQALISALGQKMSPILRPLTTTGETLLPFALGIGPQLENLPVTFGDKTPQHARIIVQRGLGVIVNSRGYLRALSQDHAQRHDLNGVPVKPVASIHQQVAAIRLCTIGWKRSAYNVKTMIDEILQTIEPRPKPPSMKSLNRPLLTVGSNGPQIRATKKTGENA